MRIVVNNLYKGDTTDIRETLRVRCCVQLTTEIKTRK